MWLTDNYTHCFTNKRSLLVEILLRNTKVFRQIERSFLLKRVNPPKELKSHHSKERKKEKRILVTSTLTYPFPKTKICRTIHMNTPTFTTIIKRYLELIMTDNREYRPVVLRTYKSTSCILCQLRKKKFFSLVS